MRMLILLGFCLMGILASGQELNRDRISVSGMHGFIIPHANGMRNVIQNKVTSYTVNWSRSGLNDSIWDDVYDYPTWGLIMYYADLGNPEQLGKVFSVYPHFDITFLQTNKSVLDLSIGAGVCYISKKYEQATNYKNVIIGSNLNSIISLELLYRYRLRKGLGVLAGINFTHFSNGAFTKPNLGLNMPSLKVGASFGFGELTKESRAMKYEFAKVDHYVYGSFGRKDLALRDDTRYVAFSLGYECSKRVSATSSLAIVGDVFYNGTVARRLEQEGQTSTFGDVLQLGVFGSYQLHIGRVRVVTGIGTYLKSKYTGDTDIYNRIGVRYDFSNGLVANVCLKSNLFKANFIEFGVGYKISRLWAE